MFFMARIVAATIYAVLQRLQSIQAARPAAKLFFQLSLCSVEREENTKWDALLCPVIRRIAEYIQQILTGFAIKFLRLR